MKRLGGIWPQVTSFDNLLLAFRKARRGKRRKDAVAAFELNLEKELLALQRDLLSGDYRPGEYRLFTLYERKPRTIAAAPFRDRVVHHALLNVIEPPIDRRFIDDSYACRGGKGVHAAVKRYQSWSRQYTYALKMDIARYFPSIDHALLKAKLRRLIKDGAVLALLDNIIDHGPPLPEDTPLVYFPGDDLFTPLAQRQRLALRTQIARLCRCLCPGAAGLGRFQPFCAELDRPCAPCRHYGLAPSHFFPDHFP